ncbi:MAG: hypothetical protein N2053_12185 [Chitinispirillaceae bacterium]|nr:hypothetical protein [Chitinispirillaceae bacterium]
MKFIVQLINNVIYISILSVLFYATIGIVIGYMLKNIMIFILGIALFFIGIVMIRNIKEIIILRGK